MTRFTSDLGPDQYSDLSVYAIDATTTLSHIEPSPSPLSHFSNISDINTSLAHRICTLLHQQSFKPIAASRNPNDRNLFGARRGRIPITRRRRLSLPLTTSRFESGQFLQTFNNVERLTCDRVDTSKTQPRWRCPRRSGYKLCWVLIRRSSSSS